ncbi:TorD/DmsD family molecular chaperone [Prosthecochloris sp. SCSIO W1103]|uniref:TorD/DmsD family molecular chaperone n=1 Tax=Prosthecochloris sp. SCSIO W1103 TaxID=2992244 RepID=UPI00223CD41A|nr:molecular chaperone TorD family protein [Prosthecochloris sp. SCSIO W1103]UZJ38198.1 molecular chaperone TorD family protein [Prosthecochloris sp. SCSIO W1103]
MEITVENKARILRFLSQCFAYPNRAFLPNLQTQLQEITAEKEKTGFESLLRLFEQENSEQLQGEYTRLFISGYPNTPCPPYESVFREGTMLGSNSRKVDRLYQEWDMTADLDLVDHISTELEFLAFLASAATLDATRTNANKAYHSFIHSHIQKWIPDFSKKLYDNAKSPPYRKLAALLPTSIPPTV